MFRCGLCAQSAFFRVYLLDGTGKIAIATARSLGNKPRRNLAKRKVREILRHTHEAWDKSFDFIVLALPAVLEIGLDKGEQELTQQVEVLKSKWAERSGLN